MNLNPAKAGEHHVHRGCCRGGPGAVLTIGKLGASPDQLGYYEQQVAQGMEDYFSGRGEAPGRSTVRAPRARANSPKIRTARSRPITTLGIVLSRNGTTTRNRDHASHAQNNTVARPATSGPSP